MSARLEPGGLPAALPARAWLLAVVLAGLLFGGAQFLRGAHAPSHTLWTAWLCWALSASLLGRRRLRRSPA